MFKKILLAALIVFMLASCAAGPNPMIKTENPDGNIAGFFQGLWHGFIALFTFIVSLFSDNVSVYEIHNKGALYDLGFIIGVSAFFGGSGKGTGCRRKNR